MMHKVLYTTTITNLHVGAGQGVGSVDLPIARERATNWPVIPGSSLKGVLRDRARLHLLGKRRSDEETEESKKKDQEKLDKTDGEIGFLYGETSNDSASSGALTLTDQRILLFPVRSLKGTFAYVTCPLAIQRANELIAIAGGTTLPSDLQNPGVDQCHAGAGVSDGDKVYLEDQDFAVTPSPGFDKVCEALKGVRPDVHTRLVIVSDTTFSYLCEHATELTTKTAIQFATKTVQDKSLRTEESIPPGAVFIGLVLANPMRSGDAEKVTKHISELDQISIQLGAKASTGLGLCKLSVVSGGNE